MSSRWPFFDLRIRTPDLELRLPTDDDLFALAELASGGIHEPGFMPFTHPWSAGSPEQRALATIQWNWRQRAELGPDKWSLDFVVLRGGTVVGTQSLNAEQFARLRVVQTGSWLGQAHQGRGIGTEMRIAVLHLAFVGLGARIAGSGAFDDNHASLALSHKLGYQDDGEEWHVRGTEAVAGRVIRLRLTRERWEAHRPTSPISIDGLDPCLPLLGAS